MRFLSWLFRKGKEGTNQYEQVQNSEIYQTEMDIPDKTNPSISSVSLSKYHNMSLNKYEVKAVYRPTNRVRKRIIYGNNKADVRAQMTDFDEPESIIEIPYDPPTERQIAFAVELDIQIPTKCCKDDLSALISEALRKEYQEFKGKPWKRIPPDYELIGFVDLKHIPYPRYAEEFIVIRDCYKFYLKEEREKVAFLIACMYKHITGNWDFQYWDKWQEDAEELLTDDSFKKSMLNNIPRFDDGFQGFDFHETISTRSKVYQMIAEKAAIQCPAHDTKVAGQNN